MVTTAAGENGMTAQNVGIGLWQKQGGRSECVPACHKYTIKLDMSVICVCADGSRRSGTSKNRCIA